jgi:hypothetical protein
MGLFSWKTQDTELSIPCEGASRKTFPVIMLDDKGNKWKESEYEGYGVFGGKDFYELLAEMNGIGSDRGDGISLSYSGKPFISPNLVESENWTWREEHPENCEYQGYFYDDEDEDEEDPWYDDEDEDEED